MRFFTKCMIFMKLMIWILYIYATNFIMKSIEIERSLKEKRLFLLHNTIYFLDNVENKKIIRATFERFSYSTKIILRNSRKYIFQQKFKIFYKVYKKSVKEFLKVNILSIDKLNNKYSIDLKEEIKKFFNILENNQEKEILDLLRIKKNIVFEEKRIYEILLFFTCNMILKTIFNSYDGKDLDEVLKTMYYKNKLKGYKDDKFNLLNILNIKDLNVNFPKNNFKIIEPCNSFLLQLYNYEEKIEWGTYDKNSKLCIKSEIEKELEIHRHKNFLEFFYINISENFLFSTDNFIFNLNYKHPQFFANFDINDIFIHTIYEILTFKNNEVEFDLDLFWTQIYEIYIICCEKVFYETIFKNIIENNNSLLHVNYIFNLDSILYSLKTYFYLDDGYKIIKRISQNKYKVIFYSIIQLLFNNFVISFKNNLGLDFDYIITRKNYINGVAISIKYRKKSVLNKQIKIGKNGEIGYKNIQWI